MGIIAKTGSEVKQDTWCQIPHEVWVDNKLTLQEKCLLGRIIALAVSTGKCFSSNDYLAKELGKSKSHIDTMLHKLEKIGYIERVRIYKDNSKQIEKRLITPILKTMIPTLIDKDTPTLIDNGDRIDVLDKSIDNIYNSLFYLEKIPEEDRNEFSLNFKITPLQVQDKADDLFNYCEAKGKRYKNYKAFLRNAIKSEYGKRLPKVIQPWEKYEQLPNEVRVGNLDRMKKLKEGIGNGKQL